MSDNLTTKDTIISAWNMAVKSTVITEELIFHSDRGVQYASSRFTDIIKNYKGLVIQSMSRKGNCWDNAVAESFFKTIKCELIYRKSFKTFIQAYSLIDSYIHWYNTKRIHQSLDYLTPLEMEIILKNIKTKRAA